MRRMTSWLRRAGLRPRQPFREGWMPQQPKLEIYPSPELRDALDRWRAAQPGIPSRAAAARFLLEKALAERGFKVAGKPKP